MPRQHPTARELYATVLPSDEKEQQVWEETFFDRLRLPNGLYKTTFAHRLDDVNQSILECIQERWPDEVLRVLDVAVSSGITTVELADALRSAGRAFEIVGTDAFIESSLLSYGRHFHVFRDSRGGALQFDIFGYPLANFVGSGLQFWRRCFPVLCARAWWQLLDLPLLRHWIGLTVRPIRLLTERWRTEPNVTFVEEDLFHPKDVDRRYHVIRASNILNPRVFSHEELIRAIKQLRTRLQIGGQLWIIRSHEDGSNNGTCFELQRDGTFRKQRSLGCGSEVEALVLDTAGDLSRASTPI